MTQSIAKPDPYQQGDRDSEPIRPTIHYYNFGGSGERGFWNAKDEVSVAELAGIPLLSRTRRVYYEGEYTGEQQDPTCESDDGLEGQWGACVDCGYAAWRGGAPECREYRRILIWHTETGEPDETANISILTVPPSSITIWDRYRSRLQQGGTRDYTTVSRFHREKQTLRNGREVYQLRVTGIKDLEKDGDSVKAIIAWRPRLQEFMRSSRTTEEEATTEATAVQPQVTTKAEAIPPAAAESETPDAGIGKEAGQAILKQMKGLGLNDQQIMAIIIDIFGIGGRLDKITKAQARILWERVLDEAKPDTETLERVLLEE